MSSITKPERLQHVSVTLHPAVAKPSAPPVQQPTCSRGGGSCTAKWSAAEDDNDDDSSSQSRNALLDTLGDDVYCYTVKCAVQGVRGCRMVKAVLAMLFTFALQIGLLVLLWEAVITGSATDVSRDTPETDKLWRQVGQVQRQVCWLNQNVVINTTAAADGNLNCAGAWPDGPFCRAWGRRLPTMSYLQYNHCLTTLFNRPLSPSLPRGLRGGELGTKPTPELQEERLALQQACVGFKDLGSSDKAFGMGLLFPDYVPINKSNAFGHAGALGTLAGMAEQHAHPYSSSEGCIPEIPHDPGQEPFIVNVLASLALATYVHHENMQALWLGYVSAACCGILPPFYLTELSKAAGCYRCSALRVALMLCAPVLQQATGIAVLISSMGLTFIRETQASVVAIILSNVALSFILDLDNRVGLMLQAQAMHSSCATATLPLRRAHHVKPLACWPRADAQATACMRTGGHMYMALLGLLLLAEPLCLAPAPALGVYVRVSADWERQTAETAWTRRAGYGNNMVFLAAIPNIMFTYFTNAAPLSDMPSWQEQTWNVKHALDMRVDYLQSKGNSLSIDEAMFGAALAYAYVRGAFVFLLYGSTLVVTAARRWNPVLLAVQALITMNAASLLDGLFFLLVGWLGLFVLWPLRHRQPTPCCRGCKSCGCPKCRGCCPGECCCAC